MASLYVLFSSQEGAGWRWGRGLGCPGNWQASDCNECSVPSSGRPKIITWAPSCVHLQTGKFGVTKTLSLTSPGRQSTTNIRLCAKGESACFEMEKKKICCCDQQKVLVSTAHVDKPNTEMRVRFSTCAGHAEPYQAGLLLSYAKSNWQQEWSCWWCQVHLTYI